MTEIRKKHTGETGNPGEFGNRKRSESALSLSAQADETFDVTVNGKFYAMEVPPGKRKPRPIPYLATTTVSIPSVTSDEAPVGIESRDGSYRVYDGDIYAPHTPWSGQTEVTVAGDDRFPTEITDGGWNHASEAEFVAEANKQFGDMLVVDGQVWRKCGEPRYVVQTFGFGMNHGGTGLMVDTYDNINIAATSYFRADEFEQAREYAIEVATERGDTNSVERFKTMEPEIVVHDPSAIRLVTTKPEPADVIDARYDFHNLTSQYQRDFGDDEVDEQVSWDALVAARQSLLSKTDDVAGVRAAVRPYREGR